MRVAIVINTSWNIYNFRLNLAKAIQKAGHQIIAIAPTDDYSQRLIDFGFEFFPIEIDNKGANPITELFQIKKFYDVYKKAKIDVVLQYTIKPNIYGSIAAKLLGIKSICNVSGLGTLFIRENWKTKFGTTLYKFAFQFPEKIFFQNGDDRSEFLERNLLYKSQTGLLPGSGVDLKKFEPQKYQRGTPFNFLMIARLLYDKGIVEYLEAAKNLKSKIDAKFLICGKVEDEANLGITKEELQKWIDEGIIDYHGHIDNIQAFIKSVDCVVLPSYREGTPKSLLEAAALNRPLIATNVPGCKEVVINEKNGLLCEVKNSKSLEEKMLVMFSKKEEQLEDYANASRMLVESKFDDIFVNDAYLTEINKIQ